MNYMKSTFGFVFIFNVGVSCGRVLKNMLQRILPLKDEYIGASIAPNETFWKSNFIEELGFIPIEIDSVTDVIAQVKEVRSH